MTNVVEFQKYLDKKQLTQKTTEDDMFEEMMLVAIFASLDSDTESEAALEAAAALFEATHEGFISEKVTDTLIADIYAKSGQVTGFEYRA